MASTFRGLLPSGRLPSAAETQVRDLIQTEAPPPDLSAYATTEDVEAAVERIEPLPAGDRPIFGTLAEAVSWMAANPGRVAYTSEPPPDPDAWQAAAPIFDQSARKVIIPDDAGATYRMDGQAVTGTVSVTPPVTVTVTAHAKAGYTLAGDTEWSHEFVLVLNAYDSAALALNPQLYYRLDDETYDFVNLGSDQSASLLGLTTRGYDFVSPGIGGFSRSIRTDGEVVSRRVAGYPKAGARAYSLAAIIRTGGYQVNAQFFRGYLAQVAPSIEARMTATPAWRAPDSSGADIAAGATGPEQDTTYHIAQTWDGSTLRFYVDGVEIASAPDTSHRHGADGLIMLAGSEGVSMAGAIIDYSRAFTPAEIAGLSSAVTR